MLFHTQNFKLEKTVELQIDKESVYFRCVKPREFLKTIKKVSGRTLNPVQTEEL